MFEALMVGAVFCLFMAFRASTKRYLSDTELFPSKDPNSVMDVLRYERVTHYHFSPEEDAITFYIGGYVFSACRPELHKWKGHYREVDSTKIEPLVAGKHPEDIYAFDSFKDLVDRAFKISATEKTGI